MCSLTKIIGTFLGEWSKSFGVEAPLSGPVFEEYSPELRSITANSSMRRTNEDDCASVVLTKQIITSNDLPGTPSVASNNNTQRKVYSECASLSKQSFTTNKFQNTPTIVTNLLRSNDDDCASVATTKQSISPNENEEPPQMQGKARILYDYRPIENDEIALTKGLKAFISFDNLSTFLDDYLEVISGPGKHLFLVAVVFMSVCKCIALIE